MTSPAPLIPGRRQAEGADLLGRDQLVLSPAAAVLFSGARVLVTGAAGTVGAAIVRRLHGVRPERVYLLDSETDALVSLAGELGVYDDIVVADVRQGAGLEEIVRALSPDVVVHAAGLGERAHLDGSPAEALWTNVRGTQNVALAAAEAGVRLLVHVSADSAGRPASVLGVSKRLAELVVAGLGQDPAGMRTMSVRVGPLLDGGTGLLQAIARHGLTGEPVTLRHPDATCPIMTAADAAALVLEAAALRGPARTYVLDAGDHVSAVEFARYLAARVGLPEPEFDYAEVAGAPLVGPTDRAAVRRTSHPRVWSLPPDEVDAAIAGRLDGLCALAANADAAELREALTSTLAAATLVEPAGR